MSDRDPLEESPVRRGGQREAPSGERPDPPAGQGGTRFRPRILCGECDHPLDRHVAGACPAPGCGCVRARSAEDLRMEALAEEILRATPYPFPPGGPTEDPVVNAVIERLAERSAQGMRTYGQSMAANPAPLLEWLEHAQEELMDGVLYLERVKREVREVMERVTKGGS